LPKLDITTSVANFREAARHLWNCHYLPFLPEDPWDARDSFDEVIAHLFASIVLEPCDIIGTRLAPSCTGQPDVVKGLLVRPWPEQGALILINREAGRSSGYWDHPKKTIAAEEAELHFARFYDWEEIGYRDFRYVEVLIVSAPADPSICGHWALLDFEYARVFANQSEPG
jgi:hypothetical protein